MNILLIVILVCILGAVVVGIFLYRKHRKERRDYYKRIEYYHSSPDMFGTDYMSNSPPCAGAQHTGNGTVLGSGSTFAYAKSDFNDDIETETGVELDTVQFMAVAEKETEKGEDIQIDIFMYEDGYRYIVDDYIQSAMKEMIVKPGGYQNVKRGSKITVILTSRKISYEDKLTLQWNGQYLDFGFLATVPEDSTDSRLSFVACVYTEGILLSRLNFSVSLAKGKEQIRIERNDIRSAFVSYASQDRARVAEIVYGMKKARRDLDLFFDIEFISSGDYWDQVLRKELLTRDLLYLCWSRNARESEWVDREWRCVYEAKGVDAIEPVPLELPDICPPPVELSEKNFNDILLYIITQEQTKKIGASGFKIEKPTIMNLKTGEARTITEGGLSIGRSAMNDIALTDDMTVSKFHCKISRIDVMRISIQDFSYNGTAIISEGRKTLLKKEMRELMEYPMTITVGKTVFLILRVS